jgi:PAT family beta-lactamase induction signal transducer AmpG
MNKRLCIVLMLGFSSGLPLALLSGALQAWFSDAGLSLMTVGLLSLIGLPHSYRFLWAPLLDRYTLFSMGKRRSWMLTMQVLLWMGFNAMAWFTPQTSPGLMAALGAVLAFFSATQDIAVDAHRTEYLPTDEQALGASVAVFGYRVALLVAGGFSLVIAQHWGWAFAYRLMGFLMLFGVIAVYFSPEPSAPARAESERPGLLQSFIDPAKALFSRQGIIPLMLFIIFYKVGESFTATTSGIVIPFLIQGIGFSLETIGYVNKVVGVGAAIVGGLSAGVLLMRWSLYRALLVFGLLQAISSLFFVALACVGKNVPLFCVAVICENFAAGMSSVALVTLFMRLVDRRFTATQYSLLIAFSSLPRILSGPIAALGQARLGWIGLYEMSFLLALVFVPLLLLVSHPKKIGRRDDGRITISDVLRMKKFEQT